MFKEAPNVIRQMKNGEQDDVRWLLANLNYEDQSYWRKQAKSLDEYKAESSKMPIIDEIRGKNVIFVAEEDNKLVGLCWCTIVDRGVDKQGEIAEFYVEKAYRGKSIGKELMTAAKKLFSEERVEVVFVWTHHSNKSAITLYQNAGFKEVDQLVMAFIPAKADNTLSQKPRGG